MHLWRSNFPIFIVRRTLLETRASGPLVPGFLSYSTFRTPSSKSKSQENQNYKLPFRRPQFSFPENEMTFVRTVMTCAMEKISSHDIAFTFSSISATNPQETIFFFFQPCLGHTVSCRLSIKWLTVVQNSKWLKRNPGQQKSRDMPTVKVYTSASLGRTGVKREGS